MVDVTQEVETVAHLGYGHEIHVLYVRADVHQLRRIAGGGFQATSTEALVDPNRQRSLVQPRVRLNGRQLRLLLLLPPGRLRREG